MPSEQDEAEIAPANDVVSLTLTCTACPSQWEGKTRDGRPVYIRYRYGFLAVHVGKPGEEFPSGYLSGESESLGVRIGGPLNGYCELDDVKRELGERLRLPIA